MQYIVVCDHQKAIHDADNSFAAIQQFKCKKCVGFVMKSSKWRFKNVRVYLANDKDIEILVDSQPVNVPKLYKDTEQIDWVGP